jgi:hypothetical protein
MGSAPPGARRHHAGRGPRSGRRRAARPGRGPGHRPGRLTAPGRAVPPSSPRTRPARAPLRPAAGVARIRRGRARRWGHGRSRHLRITAARRPSDRRHTSSRLSFLATCNRAPSRPTDHRDIEPKGPRPGRRTPSRRAAGRDAASVRDAARSMEVGDPVAEGTQHPQQALPEYPEPCQDDLPRISGLIGPTRTARRDLSIPVRGLPRSGDAVGRSPYVAAAWPFERGPSAAISLR